ncbi:MAG: CrcB family protein [Planctomycetes bacterium]|nr:CrcB family protein [Planctomycetota bacterium]
MIPSPLVSSTAIALVALGGVVGALMRHGQGALVGALPGPFPLGTLSINALGSLVLAALLARWLAPGERPLARAGLGAGLLGTYTTMSAFQRETFDLLHGGHVGAAWAYAGLSVSLALVGAAAGARLGGRAGGGALLRGGAMLGVATLVAAGARAAGPATASAAIALGGAAGAAGRYVAVTLIATRFGAAFPWGTLTVNLAGCLFMGLLVGGAGPREADALVLLALSGLGGLTTFSAFSCETLALARAGGARLALLNVALNVGGCFAAVALGAWAGHALVSG